MECHVRSVRVLVISSSYDILCDKFVTNKLLWWASGLTFTNCIYLLRSVNNARVSLAKGPRHFYDACMTSLVRYGSVLAPGSVFNERVVTQFGNEFRVFESAAR